MRLRYAVLATAMVGAAIAHPSLAQQITGAGGTFPAPVYSKWGEAAHTPKRNQHNNQAIRTRRGHKHHNNPTVDFGASDAPMDPAKLEQNHILQIPTVMGAVVPIVNLPGIQPDQLKLTGELLAEIYAGKITRWNDPKLAAANPGVTMPTMPIAPVYRADASGTSYVFTSYLSAVSPDWKSTVGVGTSVKWPAGAGARGNDGVAGTVKNTRGGIGYVENAYATQNKLTTTQLQNKAGQFVKPTMESFQAAAASGNLTGAKDFAVDLIDQPGAQTWPIVSATFLLLPEDPKDAARSANVLKFIDWAYSSGGDIASSLDYIPQPKAVQDTVRAKIKSDIK